jgi:transcription antitermination factor NusG
LFWGVVNTQPTAEKRALWHLEWQGFTAYAPRERITRIRRGKKVQDARWLFPRYVFVWITDTWHALFSTIGVSRVLMIGSGDDAHPARCPSSWIDGMRAQERNGLITLPKAPPRFRTGESVTVASGMFAGVKGLYQGTTSRQREVVLLEHLGRVELATGLLR